MKYIIAFAMDNSVGLLQEQALKRKERLQALKNKNTSAEGGEPREQLPKPTFRSYKPLDPGLRESKLPDAKYHDVKEQVIEQLAAAKPMPVPEDVDLGSLAPRKPDWDLKRDVAKKLGRLEKRTQRAIAEIIRERLKENGDISAATLTSEDINQLQI